MWYLQNYFKYAFGILLALTILLVGYYVSFILNPILEFVGILFLPVLMASIFYYLLRPIVRILESKRLSRVVSIICVYIGVLCFLALISVYIVPIVIEQVSFLTEKPNLEKIKETTSNVLKIPYLEDFFRTSLVKINEWISNNIVITIATITKFTMLIFITPFLLFYFLKDDDSLITFIIKNLPVEYHEDAKMILNDVDAVLSKFITGQALMAMVMGILLFLGYSLIGLNNAFILSIFAAIFFTIPIVGSFLALMPTILVGMSMSAFMAVKVLIVFFIGLSLEANVISPQIMSQRLNIHPAILILLLIASGTLYGILGLFLATPIFALVRVLIIDVLRIRNRPITRLRE